MVHRRIKRAGRGKSASHNRSWIWGRHVVGETLRAGRWPIQQLVLSDTVSDSDRSEFLRLAEHHRIPIATTDDDRLTAMCHAGDHQGCAAQMGEFPYLTGDALLAQLTAKSIIVVLDRIQDSHNFGAILRSAEGLGLDGVLVGERGQSVVNSQVARSSAGAANHVPIGQVEDLGPFLAELASRKWQVWGATERGSLPLDKVEFQPPLALVIGNEGTGIRDDLLAHCTATVRIPMAGRVGSLNAAVSAGILCYAAVHNRRTPPTES